MFKLARSYSITFATLLAGKSWQQIILKVLFPLEPHFFLSGYLPLTSAALGINELGDLHEPDTFTYDRSVSLCISASAMWRLEQPADIPTAILLHSVEYPG